LVGQDNGSNGKIIKILSQHQYIVVTDFNMIAVLSAIYRKRLLSALSQDIQNIHQSQRTRNTTLIIG
jgi:ribosomal protein L24